MGVSPTEPTLSLADVQLPVVGDPSAQVDLSMLAGAFSEFITASTTLEGSYRLLQSEVSYLSSELAQRNATLNASLAENQRVHDALQQIVDSMPCGIIVAKSDGMVALINAEARYLLEIESASTFTVGMISACSGLDLSGFLARGTGSEDEQEFCKISTKGKRWISVHERSLRSAGSENDGFVDPQQVILILRDVTAGKQAELDRERVRRAMALSEIATTLAHEIRNPLASLELFAGLIAGGGVDTAEWISHLRAGIRALEGTVSNVLSFHDGNVPAIDEMDLCEVISSSVEFVRPMADEAEITLTFEAASETIPVRANANAMQQLVLNLVRNAIRHTKAGGSIQVTVNADAREDHKSGRRAVVQVSDTGSGIAPENIAEIFRPGFSGNGTSSGLGLAVCRQIALQHAGSIRVESKLLEGSKFLLEMPTL